jgi:hypothetical protein
LACGERFIISRITNQAHQYIIHWLLTIAEVEITTSDGANASFVLVEVSRVMVLSPVNKAVMIQHGDTQSISKLKFCNRKHWG